MRQLCVVLTLGRDPARDLAGGGTALGLRPNILSKNHVGIRVGWMLAVGSFSVLSSGVKGRAQINSAAASREVKRWKALRARMDRLLRTSGVRATKGRAACGAFLPPRAISI